MGIKLWSVSGIQEQGLRRSLSDFTMKIHAACDALGPSLRCFIAGCICKFCKSNDDNIFVSTIIYDGNSIDLSSMTLWHKKLGLENLEKIMAQKVFTVVKTYQELEIEC